MDILLFADNFPPERNAVAARVFERARYWVRWGHEVSVVTCVPNFPEGKVFPGYTDRLYQVEVIEGIRVVRVKTFMAPNTGTVLRIIDHVSFMLAGAIAGLIQNRPDLVVGSSPQFFAACAAWLVSAIRRLPFVMEVADLWPAAVVAVGAMKKGVALQWLEKLELFLYRKASQVVLLTRSFERNLISRGVEPAKLAVSMNGADLEYLRPTSRDKELAKRYGFVPSELIVGYVGTHGMAHGLENVLDAAVQCAGMKVRFLFVGAGADREKLVRRAADLNLSNVTFVPSQPKGDLARYWSLCDVALVHWRNHPLFGRMLPAKMFEAMGVGLPILLVAPKGEASELLAETNAGVWIAPEDPRALAEVVVMLSRNRSLLERLGYNSRIAAPNFTRERQAREWIDIMNRATGKAEYAVASARSATL